MYTYLYVSQNYKIHMSGIADFRIIETAKLESLKGVSEIIVKKSFFKKTVIDGYWDFLENNSKKLEDFKFWLNTLEQEFLRSDGTLCLLRLQLKQLQDNLLWCSGYYLNPGDLGPHFKPMSYTTSPVG